MSRRFLMMEKKKKLPQTTRGKKKKVVEKKKQPRAHLSSSLISSVKATRAEVASQAFRSSPSRVERARQVASFLVVVWLVWWSKEVVRDFVSSFSLCLIDCF